ncbi:MAG: choline/ethanolamine kinase family protein [Campylobacterota bacterium]
MNIQKLTNHSFFKSKRIKRFKLLKNQGVCNKIYKIDTLEDSYCLRVFKHFHNQNNHRKNEYDIQKQASKIKIAPKPYVFDEEFMLCDFLEGRHKKTLSKKEIKAITKTLKKLHKIDYKDFPYSLKKEFKEYRKKIKDKKSKKLIKNSLQDLKKLNKYKKNTVLCHHDLNVFNIIFSKNKAFLIDWEFACINDSFFDLASICVEFRLNKKQENYFLKCYLNKVKPYQLKKIEIYKRIYKNLWNLWFKALDI